MIRVLIVDDEILLRSCMQRILESEPDIEVPAACDGRGAVDAVEAHRPDVVLLDLRMPDVDGLSVLAALRSRSPRPAVAVLTTFSADEDIAAALGAGASGFLLKDATPHELADAVRVLASGGTVLSSAAARVVVGGYLERGPQPAPRDPRLDSLTEREHQVLELLAEGLTNADIGRRLLMSPSTTKEHVSAILAKLGLANRVQAAVLAHSLAAAAPSFPSSRPLAVAASH
ncbi:response regulator transcription factor [Streptomyces sp. WAC05374]|uniref:response regulator n=1 Tax=Streptomyces sp. WAC05374 TaxID=2487420 RepID=UPI000F889023|nr:response regulator transcription factor [Streptomyces sp. WAC05374]RST05331.1 DNA-binding response regulator [Streptomyces sp. WAC05374]TDF44675.1 response regulator transcription factor [Streptomyces sp. WAC05374]TDF56713.1 response regulator transcription factor [Streptomyces sp. WAC05374]TDF59911.1 response regulator transcription factor [Streptomyces sp. WAC05374]